MLLYHDSEKVQEAAATIRTRVPRQTGSSSTFRNPNLSMLGAVASVAAATLSFGRQTVPAYGTQHTGIRRAAKVLRRVWKATRQEKKPWPIPRDKKRYKVNVSPLPPETKEFEGSTLKGKLPEMPPGFLQGQGNEMAMAQESLKRMSGMLNNTVSRGRRYKKLDLSLKPITGYPYADRVMLCKCCSEQLALKRGSEPKKLCQNSSLIELDMTSEFTRENLMVVSCGLAQMIRDDVWVVPNTDEERGFSVANKGYKLAGAAFPAQICRVCKKTSFEEGRQFITCERCRGVHYCSEGCKGKHYFQHKATCTKNYFPFRKVYGVRMEMEQMRSELLPLTKFFSVKQVGHHLLPWRKKHYEALRGVSKEALPEPRKQLAPASATSANITIGSPEAALAETATPIRPKFATSNPKRSVRIDTEPDENVLGCLGMTKEAYVQRQQQLQETEEERESRIAAHMDGMFDLFYGVEQNEAEELKMEEATTEVEQPQERDTAKFTPQYLQGGALERLQEAVLQRRDKPVMRPAWKGFGVEEPGTREVDAALVEREEGVVYKTMRWRLQKYEELMGRKVSEEEIKNFEKAVEMGRTSKKYQKKIERAVDREKMKEWLVPLKKPASWN